MNHRSSSESVGEALERLQRELAQANARVEEVAAYYRGEVETVRQRAEDEAIRVQASEAGRRKRAEDQAVRLGSELETARRETEHAQRRYADLRHTLETLERNNQAADGASAEEREATRAAWRTAEEEVARLDTEIDILQGKLEEERASARDQMRERDKLIDTHQRTEEHWRELMVRLRRGFKASEQRRQALEASLAEVAERERPQWRRGLDPADTRVVVDPTTGWGSASVAEGDDLSDEFTLVESDSSIRYEASQGIGISEEVEVSPEEAETLLMRLNVDRRLAERGAGPRSRSPGAPQARAPSNFTSRAPRRTPGTTARARARAEDRASGGLLLWLFAGGVVGVAVVLLALVLF